ncbi:MAG: YraN family protein [Candidatus Aegiribacteria sp.]|nr:YraN family protein [Candidatus Aegiribacteria sp.]
MSDISRGAEGFVCEWLQARGWTVVARNFRTRRAEVDIIAKSNGILAFVEVKFASDGSTTMPLEKIDSKKQARIIHAAGFYLAKHDPQDQIRFDVAVVRGTSSEFRMDTYLEDAFRPEPL